MLLLFTIAVLPALLLLVYMGWKDRQHPEPTSCLLKGLLFGVLSIIVSMSRSTASYTQFMSLWVLLPLRIFYIWSTRRISSPPLSHVRYSLYPAISVLLSAWDSVTEWLASDISRKSYIIRWRLSARSFSMARMTHCLCRWATTILG